MAATTFCPSVGRGRDMHVEEGPDGVATLAGVRGELVCELFDHPDPRYERARDAVDRIQGLVRGRSGHLGGGRKAHDAWPRICREHRKLLKASFGPQRLHSRVLKALALVVESGLMYSALLVSAIAISCPRCLCGLDVRETELINLKPSNNTADVCCGLSEQSCIVEAGCCTRICASRGGFHVRMSGIARRKWPFTVIPVFQSSLQ